jgi:Zn-dependent peptidase ImmA (M78 family)
MVRIPKKVGLPFGYVIQVREVSDAEMRLHDDDGELQDGLWDVEIRTIFIRACLPVRRRAYLLIHETGHALWDLQHQYLDEGAIAP